MLLYNSKGDYIAFTEGMYVFDVDGRWIGFMHDDIVYNTKSIYLGTIHGNRLYNDYRLEKNYIAKHVDFPGYPKMFPFPPPTHQEELPEGLIDVKIKIPFF